VKQIVIGFVVMFGLGQSSIALAQTCAGGPSFAAGPAHVSYGLGLTSNTTGNGGTIAVGNDKVFAGGGISALNIDGVSGTSLGYNGVVGAQVHDARNKVFVCPAVSVGYLNGPQVLGIDTSTTSVEGGASLGIVAAKAASVTVIPNVRASVVREQLNLKGVSGSNVSETFGLATFGMGLVFNERYALTPHVSVPVGLDGAKPTFALALTAAFGRK
jgi:hypothetical protein